MISKMKLSWVAVAAIVAMAGCGDDDGTDTPTDDVPMEDMGTTMADDMGAEGGLSCQDRVPTDGFGAIPGSNMSEFFMPLQTCDGTEYSFYNEDFCEAEVTVISIAAGWCPPCIMESMQLEAEINAIYASQGVRVIQILTQKEDGTAPDLAYCDEWVSRFGLSNIELIDPAQFTSSFFPDNSLPSTIIIDSEGVIRFRENGASDGLTTLKAAIDEVLGG